MKVPGFTAEATVYATDRSYRMIARIPGSNGTPGVSPSLIGSRVPGRDCIQGCICVQPEGCPCCESIWKAWNWQRPFAIRAPSTVLTCEPRQEAVCKDWCQQQGGGMSSNPDGSTTCT